MTIILNLKPEVEASLQDKAAQRGLSLLEFVDQSLRELAERHQAEAPATTDGEHPAIRLARMQPQEREAILRAAAIEAEEDYHNGSDFTAFTRFDEPIRKNRT